MPGGREIRGHLAYPADGEVSTLNQQKRRSRNSGDVLKKTPATRGTRRGRLGESGLFKVSVEVEQVVELVGVEDERFDR